MRFDALIRSAVATADRITAALQDAVTHEAWTGADAYGNPTYAAGVSRDAIVEYNPAIQRLLTGQIVTATARVLFLRPIAANGASGRREPLDPRDRFTLPDGRQPPVLSVDGGLVDPSTGRSYFGEVLFS